MSSEIKGFTSNEPTKKEKIWRPLAVLAVSGVFLGGTPKSRQSDMEVPSPQVYIFDAIEPLQHDFEIVPNDAIQGPIEPKVDTHSDYDIELQAEQEFTLGIENALAVKAEAEVRLKQQEAELRQKEVESASVRQQGDQKKVSPPVQAASISTAQGEEISTKVITGYYCEYDYGFFGDGGGFCGLMADGINTHDGAAACGPSYPLGSIFEIEGYGQVVCEDRGGGVGDNHIDVFTYYSSGLSSIPSGSRTVTKIK